MITSMYDFKDQNGNIMPYKQYEERKIMEAVELAKKVENGKIETIPIEEAMKRLDATIARIEKEYKNRIIKEEKYVV